MTYTWTVPALLLAIALIGTSFVPAATTDTAFVVESATVSM
ncbi:MAG: hypothetical protein AAGE03_13350 [Pseudomonadota bacterium]